MCKKFACQKNKKKYVHMITKKIYFAVEEYTYASSPQFSNEFGLLLEILIWMYTVPELC